MPPAHLIFSFLSRFVVLSFTDRKHRLALVISSFTNLSDCLSDFLERSFFCRRNFNKLIYSEKYIGIYTHFHKTVKKNRAAVEGKVFLCVATFARKIATVDAHVPKG